MESQSYTTVTFCRACNSPLKPLFSLGMQRVSDFVAQPFLQCEDCGGSGEFFSGHCPVCAGKGEVPAGIFAPIELVLCEACTLVQNPHTVDQGALYSRKYWYRSGVTETMHRALADVSLASVRESYLASGDTVLDIGSNDGTLLRCYPTYVTKIGFDPGEQGESRVGIDYFVQDFWSYEGLQQLRGRGYNNAKPKIITAIGMLYDLPDPNPLIADVKKALHPNGVFIAQLMCLRNMVDMNDIGNLCHEHLEFYTIKSLQMLFEKHELEIYKIEANEVNGGSYRLYVSHPGKRTVDVKGIEGFKELDDVCEHGSFGNGGLVHWFARCKREMVKCVEFISKEFLAHKRTWVYGASTKGNVFLQWAGLDAYVIGAASERSPEKVGLYTIGSGIPIKSEEEFRQSAPDYALVLPYAFLPEFIQRERAWLENGGKFIVPYPEFKVVGKEVLR